MNTPAKPVPLYRHRLLLAAKPIITSAFILVASLYSQFALGAGSLLRTFNDPTITSGDVFGNSVAIDGDYVLIGAIGHDTPGLNVGQAHLFDATNGILLQSFDDPTPTTFDFFGRSVAIDGEYVLVGANGDDTVSTNAGQAHLFDATTGDLVRTFDNTTSTGGRGFGVSVAIDGGMVLIGAPLES